MNKSKSNLIGIIFASILSSANADTMDITTSTPYPQGSKQRSEFIVTYEKDLHRLCYEFKFTYNGEANEILAKKIAMRADNSFYFTLTKDKLEFESTPSAKLKFYAACKV